MKIAEQTLSFKEGLASKPGLGAIKVLYQLRVWSIYFCSECNWKCGSKQPFILGERQWDWLLLATIHLSAENQKTVIKKSTPSMALANRKTS